MLPSPVSFAKRRPFRRDGSIPRYKVADFLLSRTRVTNLGIIFLASALLVSLLFNLLHIAQTYHFSDDYGSPGLFATISRDDSISDLTHLIIVPGHAIWKGTDPQLRLREDQWILEPYQRGGGRVATFFAHILRAAQLAIEDKDALLVFSGGQTRSVSTTTEAESYMRLALSADVFHTPASFIRSTTENHALDSFQNLLFSIARFHEYTGNYPTKITVVGYEFKRARFVDLHRAALRWPKERFNYIGVDPDDEHNVISEQGEVSQLVHLTS
ncbi:hypothetical protein BDZ94DRAFT_1249113 [Collybia nuda]|uniref:DUF218 domain-containing protein n=1 Tax=Collybia nuda TaxID=64659 RepID=A0A9P5YEE4_9AGAR|nr:hypothetical protein BDZ94DRAFT_1249113 [Collybia nuda]